MSSAAIHTQRLEAVQRLAPRIVADNEDQQQAASVTTLEHRQDVSALVMCHKVLVQGVSHLDPLKMLPHTTQRCTRGVTRGGERLKVPYSLICQLQRTYTARGTRLWNMFTVATPNVKDMSTH